MCPGNTFNPYTLLSDELTDCGPSSTLNIASTTVSGVATGAAPTNASPISSGILTVQVLDEDGDVCEVTDIEVELLAAEFTATPVDGSCHLVDISAVQNSASCNYTFNIDGTNYPGPDLNDFQFPNGGTESVTMTVQCGTCVQTATQDITIPGPEAGLSFSSPSGTIFFDPTFNTLVLCSSEPEFELDMTDISFLVGAGADYEVTVGLPDGTVLSSTDFPSPFNVTTPQAGIVSIDYEINDGGCISTVSYEMFFSSQGGTTQLDVPVNIGSSRCQDEDFSLTVCPGGCPDNPPGTVYTVILGCTSFFYETITVPFTVDIPLNVGSCGSTCIAGATISNCACELVVVATRPCAPPASATFCPFQIQPQPEARFEVEPNPAQNTFCEGEILEFIPEWESVDCDPFNPDPSICEIMNQDWEITPATGWTNLTGNLTDFPLDIRFDDPGEYTICFQWENPCGTDNHCETVCILDSSPPVADPKNNEVYCVGDVINPEVTYPTLDCAPSTVSWTSSGGVAVADPAEDIPSLTFTAPGFHEVDLEIEGLCQPYENTFEYNVCDVPELTVSQTDVTLCVGQEFCLASLATIVWNNCTGDVEWSIPGDPGSPFVNPLSGETCISRDAAEIFTVQVEVSNDCGTDLQTIEVTVEESPLCTIAAPDAFCTGGSVDIDVPAGSVDPEWFVSADGTNFAPLPGGMPHNPAATSYYYVASDVNGCFCVSDTVVAELIAEPDFAVSVSSTTPCPGTPVTFTTSPAQGPVNWTDENGDLIAVDDSIEIDVTAPFTATAELVYGTATVQCAVSESASVTPETDPIDIDCASIPALLCVGDAAVPLPSLLPAGGLVEIGTPGNVLITDPAEIDPEALGAGDYFLYYSVTGIGPEGCSFKDSCAFEITPPQLPQITPAVDSLCYGTPLSFSENTGLSGVWSSDCAGAIDPATGLFDPAAAACPPDAVTEIYYTGNCIQNLTVPIFLIDVPAISITADNADPCPGETVVLTANPAAPSTVWTDVDNTTIGNGESISVVLDEQLQIFATAEFGSSVTSCPSSANVTLTPATNPVVIDCGALPANICVGNAPTELPDAAPAGGTISIRAADGTVTSAPGSIDPDILGAGDFTLIYEIENWGAGGCTFSDSCQFAVSEPQVPQIIPDVDSLCFNTPLQLTDAAGLGGTWASDCPGGINSGGLFDPAAAGCPADAATEITYSGNCILDQAFDIYVHAVPSVNLNVPVTDVCTNRCITMSADISGNFDAALWTLTWPGSSAEIAPGGDFCPEAWGITSSAEVSAVMEVTTATSPVCTVTESLNINVIGIPSESFILESPQCLEGGITLPECDECMGYEVTFTDADGNMQTCQQPGGGCFLPDTGVYQASAVFDYGFCQSDPREGELTVADAPYLEILAQDYDSCAPVVNYTALYGGYDIEVVWSTAGQYVGTVNAGENTYIATINHNTPVQVDTLYEDLITVSNFCGTQTASATVYHQALPDFTIDPDNAYYCSAEIFEIEFGFAQPLQVDSITLTYVAGTETFFDVLPEIPDSGMPFSFEAVTDTLTVEFEATAFNACGEITKNVTVNVMPRDVSADVDIFYKSPLCPGDTVPLVFNSSGNVNLEARTVTTNNPDLKVVKIFGAWYLVPQPDLEDGTHTVTLTEFGSCGVDADTEQITTGPTLEVAFEAADVCLGKRTRFTPLIGSEADLFWTFEPDVYSTASIPPPHRYENPGLYFPSVTAVNPDFCDGFYARPVEVFAPAVPEFICDLGCNGIANECRIDFNDGSICIDINNDHAFLEYEWRVRGRFIPEYGSRIRIPVDDLRPCENNAVEVRVIDTNGCNEVGRRNISFNDGLIHIPNSFTPNADGVNDFFRPVILGEPFDYHLAVMDRWGRTVWETNDHRSVWRGEDAAAEHYVGAQLYNYVLSWKPCNRAEDKMKVITGHITVVR